MSPVRKAPVICGQCNMGMRELIAKELLFTESIFEIHPLDKYKEGGVAWRRNRNNIWRRDQLLALSDEDLLELYRNRTYQDGFNRAEEIYDLGY